MPPATHLLQRFLAAGNRGRLPAEREKVVDDCATEVSRSQHHHRLRHVSPLSYSAMPVIRSAGPKSPVDDAAVPTGAPRSGSSTPWRPNAALRRRAGQAQNAVRQCAYPSRRDRAAARVTDAIRPLVELGQCALCARQHAF